MMKAPEDTRKPTRIEFKRKIELQHPYALGAISEILKNMFAPTKRGRPPETELALRVIDLKDRQKKSWSQVTKILQSEPGNKRAAQTYRSLYRNHKSK